jgi:D-glycero-D-manno-heptose 1,7-bisphosphate phosphatase
MGEPPRIVFLDRDGTIIEDRGYVGRAEHVRWIPGALDALKRLYEAGFLLAVVTNQPGVGHGYYTTSDVRTLHRWMDGQIRAAGAEIAAYRFSPYHPRARVARYRKEHPTRKPGIGMFEAILGKLAREGRSPDLTRSYMIGDKSSDLVPGHALGMATVLVETGFGRQEAASRARDELAADHVVPDLTTAANLLLRQG